MEKTNDVLKRIADTLDALLALQIAQSGTIGRGMARVEGDAVLRSLMKRYGLVSVNDGTFPVMTTGRAMGVPDVRYHGEVWSAFPLLGDTFVTDDTAKEIKAFCKMEGGK